MTEPELVRLVVSRMLPVAWMEKFELANGPELQTLLEARKVLQVIERAEKKRNDFQDKLKKGNGKGGDRGNNQPDKQGKAGKAGNDKEKGDKREIKNPCKKPGHSGHDWKDCFDNPSSDKYKPDRHKNSERGRSNSRRNDKEANEIEKESKKKKKKKKRSRRRRRKRSPSSDSDSCNSCSSSSSCDSNYFISEEEMSSDGSMFMINSEDEFTPHFGCPCFRNSDDEFEEDSDESNEEDSDESNEEDSDESNDEDSDESNEEDSDESNDEEVDESDDDIIMPPLQFSKTKHSRPDIKIMTAAEDTRSDNQIFLSDFSGACDLAEDNSKDDCQICGRPNQFGESFSKSWSLLDPVGRCDCNFCGSKTAYNKHIDGWHQGWAESTLPVMSDTNYGDALSRGTSEMEISETEIAEVYYQVEMTYADDQVTLMIPKESNQPAKKKTPGQLVYGRDMIHPTTIYANWEMIREARRNMQISNNNAENQKRIEHTYNVGDKVLLLIKRDDRKHKLARPTEGPFRVLIVRGATVQIQRGAYREFINIRRIKPYNELV